VLRHRLAASLKEACSRAQAQGLLPPMALPEVIVEHPQHPEHGDYASSLPLKLVGAARMDPMNLARGLLGLLGPLPEMAKIEVAPPGFINFTLSPSWLAGHVETILAEGENYGNIDLGKGKRVQVEFVSANPTGPLHVGHGRGAVLGSTLARVLQAAGFSVEKEYYVNDAGTQIDAFQRSLYARYLQALGQPAEMPAEGYMGQYMVDLAHDIAGEFRSKFLDQPVQLGRLGMERMLQAIRDDLDLLGAEFDVWFSEGSLFQEGQFERVMAILEKGGYVEEREGARWFTSTALGESKDNVLIRSSGAPTYFASDTAYHFNKFLVRGFEQVIDVWGADHQGHVSRMRAAVSALGINPERLRIIISQLVTLRRGGEVVRVSKRSGDIITLREVLDEVGADACRFVFLSRSADSQMDFDLELVKKESDENPVYYVQYAHARIASILRKAQERGYTPEGGDASLLKEEPELTLIRKMLLLSEMVENMALKLEPHHLPHYAQDLATTFHLFYKKCRVLSKDRTLSSARLKLALAAKTVLARTLHLMGMTAPESM
jgi:arginyl-tRNA synthetase